MTCNFFLGLTSGGVPLATASLAEIPRVGEAVSLNLPNGTAFFSKVEHVGWGLTVADFEGDTSKVIEGTEHVNIYLKDPSNTEPFKDEIARLEKELEILRKMAELATELEILRTGNLATGGVISDLTFPGINPINFKDFTGDQVWPFRPSSVNTIMPVKASETGLAAISALLRNSETDAEGTPEKKGPADVLKFPTKPTLRDAKDGKDGEK